MSRPNQTIKLTDSAMNVRGEFKLTSAESAPYLYRWPEKMILQERWQGGYTVNMSTKELAIRSLQELPSDATWEDIQERINFIAGVRRGLRELDEGKGIPHARVREEFAEWLTN